eukprot:scaffold70454_cov57-Attheya_sp.AAC.3
MSERMSKQLICLYRDHPVPHPLLPTHSRSIMYSYSIYLDKLSPCLDLQQWHMTELESWGVGVPVAAAMHDHCYPI